MVQELNYGRINMFWFLIGLARAGQAIYYFCSPLPALGKPLFFLKHHKLPLFYFLCNPQHPFVDVVGEFTREGQGNDNIGRDAKSFSREVFLVEA